MKFSKTIFSALLLASTATFADTYNGEVELRYFGNGASVGDTLLIIDNVSSLQIRGTYNFSAVDTTNKPLAEADFLGKHSFINASYSSIDSDDSNYFDLSNSKSIGAGFYIPNSIFYIGAGYAELDDSNDTVVSLGITPIDGLLITTSHNDEAKDYSLNLSAKYVTQLAGDTAINLETGYKKGRDAEDDFEEDKDDTIYVAADYYFNSRLSVGAAFIDAEASVYIIRSRYFYSEKVSFKAEAISADNQGAFNLGAAIRF